MPEFSVNEVESPVEVDSVQRIGRETRRKSFWSKLRRGFAGAERVDTTKLSTGHEVYKDDYFYIAHDIAEAMMVEFRTLPTDEQNGFLKGYYTVLGKMMENI